MYKKKIKKSLTKLKYNQIFIIISVFVIIIFISLTNLFSPANAQDTVFISEFPVPTNNSSPLGITSGPDGNIWFTEANSDKIGRITTNGTITEFPLPTSNTAVRSITTGPDGNLWFTENAQNKIGKITPQGEITEFSLPSGSSSPYAITSGFDGNLWFTESVGNKVGKITPQGEITEFPLAPRVYNRSLSGITKGPDGNVWFATLEDNIIGKITPEGVITEFNIQGYSHPQEIITGPDGNLWFTQPGLRKIARMTTSGEQTEFNVTSINSTPYAITTGSDGNIWFTELNNRQIGRITPDGTITEFPVLEGSPFPYGITSGPDGNIWMTELGSNKIAKINPFNTPISLTPTKQQGSILNVPLLKQSDAAWGNNEFDHADLYGGFHCGRTIAQCGCAMTSTAMILQYFGVNNLPDGTPLNPGTFNIWLKANNGYFRDEGLNPYVAATVAKKAKSQNFSFHYDGLEYSRVNVSDTIQLTTDLQNGIPDVLEEPGHFIVGTGIDANTVTINDPYYNRTTLATYNNSFLSLGRYVPSHTDLSYIVLAVNKDVNISLKDSLGNRVGQSYLQYHLFDPATTSGIDITNPSLKILAYQKPFTDTYQINIDAPTVKDYNLDIYNIDKEGNNTLQTNKGTVAPNIDNKFSLSFDKQLSKNSNITPIITLYTLKLDIDELYKQSLIDNYGIFFSLETEVKLAIKANDTSTKNGTKISITLLKTFLLELNSQRDKHIKESAYQILNNEANYLIKNLGTTQVVGDSSSGS
ncbi:MAG TPA: C39 family peptidase [Candidatus Saccharimonadales bacterium]|nr:C39 family peptidase [Candidatus Saccharimonadales bacterium]